MKKEDYIAQILLKGEAKLKNNGWLSHHVFETELREFNGLANSHTHGLEENFGHLDFQMVLPINPSITESIFTILAERVKAGEVFEEGKEYYEIITNFPVHFKEFSSDSRKVLRLILPDENGKTPKDSDCKEPYNRQYEQLKDI
ncbi:MAG: DUF4262 domain-containing protein [Psychrobacillus sp.]